MTGRQATAVLLVLPLAGCAGAPLSALDPAGPAASDLAGLWWVLFWGSIAILALVIALAVIATMRNGADGAPVRLLLWGLGIALPLGVGAALLVHGTRLGNSMLADPSDENAFVVEVVAHQWWWEIRYPDVAGTGIVDANEIHIPVGRPVHIRLTSADVVHAFWVPRLGGKIDAIPGRENLWEIEADAPGIFRGQCAEFCGLQHAAMGFHVVAHATMAEVELALTAAPVADRSDAGRDAFGTFCAQCHSLDRADPSPSIAPNLARIAERLYVGAGWVPNEGDTIALWIAGHQDIKPGNLMPELDLDPQTVAAIAAFLGGTP